MTIEQLLQNSILTSPVKDLLLAYVLDKPKEYLLSHNTEKVSKLTLTKFNKYASLLINEYPISYLTHNKEFYGVNYFVNQNVLIPRPETELLVDLGLKEILKRGSKPIKILEIGTGSGCITISLLLHAGGNINIKTIDKSRKALQIAKLNSLILLSNKQRARISYQNIDINKWRSNEQFDLIISNPPYVTPKEYKYLPLGIKNCEPKLALVGPEDGQFYYKVIYRILTSNLIAGGTCILELNSTTALITKKLFAQKFNVELIQDLAQLPRVLVVNN